VEQRPLIERHAESPRASESAGCSSRCGQPWSAPDNATFLMAEYSAATMLELLTFALVNRQFKDAGREILMRELRRYSACKEVAAPQNGAGELTDVLPPQAAQLLLSLPKFRIRAQSRAGQASAELRQAVRFGPFGSQEVLFHCKDCHMPILQASDIISCSRFRIRSRPAYMAKAAHNIVVAETPYSVQQATGQYMVSDVSCGQCSVTLGRVFVSAGSPERQDRVGKIVISSDLLYQPTCCRLSFKAQTVKMPARLCSRCLVLARRGVLQATRLMTHDFSLPQLRQTHELLCRQVSLEEELQSESLFESIPWASGSGCLLRAKRSVETIIRAQRHRYRLEVSSQQKRSQSEQQWQKIVEDRLAAIPWSLLQHISDKDLPAAFAAVARFVGAFTQVADHESLLDGCHVDRASLLLRLIPSLLKVVPAEQRDLLYRAWALASALRTEWVSTTCVQIAWSRELVYTCWRDASLKELEAISCALAAHAVPSAASRLKWSSRPPLTDAAVSIEGQFLCAACGGFVAKVSDLVVEPMADQHTIGGGPAHILRDASVTVSPQTVRTPFASGEYSISDVYCLQCRAGLGIKYVSTEDGDDIRVGRCLLGKRLLCELPGVVLPLQKAELGRQLLEVMQTVTMEEIDSPTVLGNEHGDTHRSRWSGPFRWLFSLRSRILSFALRWRWGLVRTRNAAMRRANTALGRGLRLAMLRLLLAFVMITMFHKAASHLRSTWATDLQDYEPTADDDGALGDGKRTFLPKDSEDRDDSVPWQIRPGESEAEQGVTDWWLSTAEDPGETQSAKEMPPTPLLSRWWKNFRSSAKGTPSDSRVPSAGSQGSDDPQLTPPRSGTRKRRSDTWFPSELGSELAARRLGQRSALPSQDLATALVKLKVQMDEAAQTQEEVETLLLMQSGSSSRSDADNKPLMELRAMQREFARARLGQERLLELAVPRGGGSRKANGALDAVATQELRHEASQALRVAVEELVASLLPGHEAVQGGQPKPLDEPLAQAPVQAEKRIGKPSQQNILLQ